MRGFYMLAGSLLWASVAAADPSTWNDVLHVAQDGARVVTCHEDTRVGSWCVVYSVRSGDRSGWFTHPPKVRSDSRPIGVAESGGSQAAAWRAFRTQLQLTPLAMAVHPVDAPIVSPNGAYSAEVRIQELDDDAYRSTEVALTRVDVVGPQGRRTVAIFEPVRRHGHERVLLGWSQSQVFVSEDLFDDENRSSSGMDEVATVSQPLGLAIQIVVPHTFDDSLGVAAEHVLARAGQGGWTVGPTDTPRATSVLFFAEGHRARAEIIASLLPFGADLQPLTTQGTESIVFAPGMDLISGIEPPKPTPSPPVLQGMLGTNAVDTIERDGGRVYRISGLDSFWDGPSGVNSAAALAPMSAFAAQKASPLTPYTPCVNVLGPAKSEDRLGGRIQVQSVQREGYDAIVALATSVHLSGCALSDGRVMVRNAHSTWVPHTGRVRLLLPGSGGSSKWIAHVAEGLRLGEVELGEADAAPEKTTIYAKNVNVPEVKAIAEEQGWDVKPLQRSSDVSVLIMAAE